MEDPALLGTQVLFVCFVVLFKGLSCFCHTLELNKAGWALRAPLMYLALCTLHVKQYDPTQVSTDLMTIDIHEQAPPVCEEQRARMALPASTVPHLSYKAPKFLIVQYIQTLLPN